MLRCGPCMHVYIHARLQVLGDRSRMNYLLVTVDIVCSKLHRFVSFNTFSGCQDPSSVHVMMAVLFTLSQLTVAVVPTNLKAGLVELVTVASGGRSTERLHVTEIN